MIAIIDYGVGNLFSLKASLARLGLDAAVTNKAADIEAADKIILPGVGAFADAAQKLSDSKLIPCIMEAVQGGKPLLGICLGMQLLFETSYEYGAHKGLGLIPGEVVPLDLPDGLKVPHMGWNSLEIKKPSPLFKYIKNGEFVYYVHSYHAVNCKEYIFADSFYGVPVTGAVQNGKVFGTQFHPEKSGETGLNILRAFAEVI